MKRAVGIILVGLAIAAGGCSDRHSDNTREQVKLYKELNRLLETITDKTTLGTAIPQAAELNARLAKNEAERRAAPKQTEEQVRAARAKYGDKLKQQSDQFGAHMGGSPRCPA